ncbi:glycerol kinase [Nitrosomonas sp. PY1]|nr:glycerol kinase [Nitrosomonas sp. PY1]
MRNPDISAIALDLGTTSIKATLMDTDGNLCHVIRQDAPAISHHNGYYESDGLAYLATAEQVLKQCLNHTHQKPPLGLCSQRSSFLIWEKSSGDPVIPLISWQDTRGRECCNRLYASTELIQRLAGLRLTPYYFAPKLNILLRENPSWRDKLIQKQWLVGTLDTFLIWRWTRGQHYWVDASMAARTLLMDIHQQQWSRSLCELFEIPLEILPDIRSSTGLNVMLESFGLTLMASVADQSAAYLASVDANLADASTRALVNLGTGGFVIRTFPQESSVSNGYLHTLVYQPVGKLPCFAIEGTLNSIAAVLAPYSIEDCVIEEMADNDIFCLAEPSGLGAPYFRQDYGLYFSQSISLLTQQQIVVLLLEAICFRIARIIEDFHSQLPLAVIYLSGGLSALPCLQYGIGQCVPLPIYCLQQKEASLQGTALLATNDKVHCFQEASRISIIQKSDKLNKKFLAWKEWLDGLLLEETKK